MACPYPFGEPVKLELAPEYARLRAAGVISRIAMPHGGEAWLATRHDHVRTVLSDPRFSRAATVGRDMPRTAPALKTDVDLRKLDPPEHTRLRRLISHEFSSHRVAGLVDRIQSTADELVDRMTALDPPVDLVQHFALALPISTICEILGVPADDRKKFQSWSDRSLLMGESGHDEVRSAREELKRYLLDITRRRNPGLLGALLRDERGGLTEEEVVIFGSLLLVAGYENTACEISNFICLLFSHQHLREQVLADPTLIPDLVEELLRFTPLLSAASFARLATEDVRLGDVLIAAGDAVVIQLAAPNRDPSIFDSPDELVLGRRSNSHLAFGYGPHYCLGAELARAQLRIAIGTLFTRLPDLRPAGSLAGIPFKKGRLIRGPESLMVTW
ncbi:cytochrome P450 [Streptomyces sp. NBC_01433]|uniref:cytochrome P450 n=1 Tax=Streptomyces sp. NBC_01433 TaxID=2903864 RepID=UPI002256ACD2|nr:cytochrome P450 [Streptomyces sp. NBC_01433]MCX4679450.1 cytochrome P450 [Streptomyces sp. NBC_01433]